MTLPDERTRAVLNTREWLIDLLYVHTGRITKRELRKKAASLLRHYPGQVDMRNPAKAFAKLPSIPAPAKPKAPRKPA